MVREMSVIILIQRRERIGIYPKHPGIFTNYTCGKKSRYTVGSVARHHVRFYQLPEILASGRPGVALFDPRPYLRRLTDRQPIASNSVHKIVSIKLIEQLFKISSGDLSRTLWIVKRRHGLAGSNVSLLNRNTFWDPPQTYSLVARL